MLHFLERTACMHSQSTHLRPFHKKDHSEYTLLSSSQTRTLNLFFLLATVGIFLAMLGIILYYVYAFASLSNGSHAFDWLLGIFSDFVAIMDASISGSPYVEAGASYPPFAIALLFPFAWICRDVLALYAPMNLTIDELTSRVIRHPEFWVAFVLFFLICTSAIIFAAIAKCRFDKLSSLKLALIIMFSSPFVFAIMRGNTIYFAFIFLLLFLLLYENESPAWREVAYLCLAIAGMIKIYPLFFGVFLLHKKKWFASFRVGVYFAIGSLLAFFFYQDGLNNLSPFVQQLGSFMSENDRLLVGRNLSVSSILYKLFYLFSLPTAVFRYVNLSVLIAIFLLATVTASYTRSHFSRYVIASGIVILIPSISYFYVLIFSLLPFMEFIRTYDSHAKSKQILYTVLFAMLFFTPLIMPQQFIIHSLAVIVMFAIECKEVLKKELFGKSSSVKLSQ